MKRHKIIFIIAVVLCCWTTATTYAQTNTKNIGTFYNLVCFVRFADEAETVFEKNEVLYNYMFNDSTSEKSNSMYNYFKQSSYHKLSFISQFAPGFKNGIVVSVQDPQKRGYYSPQTDKNPDGYTMDMIGNMREAKLVENIANVLTTTLPDTLKLDANKDNAIDNITIVVSKSQETRTSILWPHQSILMLKEAYIHGKRVGQYTMQFETQLDAGVICHESMHSLGAPDLYHYDKKFPAPIGTWDLMATNNTVPQGMSAYTKWKYGNWIKEIPEITTSGTYTLYPVHGIEREIPAYKIKEEGKNEYFVVEYRKKEGIFEGNLAASGLLIYRVNDQFKGNANYNGVNKFDELYLFRPNGSTTSAGQLRSAPFSQESGRTFFSAQSNPAPQYNDGSMASFAIKEIGSCGESITFTYEKIASSIDDLSTAQIAYYNTESRSVIISTEIKNAQYRLYDSMGRLIKNGEMAEDHCINLSEQENGIYILTLNAANGVNTNIKFIIR